MAKKQTGPTATQLKGEDGRFETVTLKSGTVINAHDYDEEEHGALAEPRQKGKAAAASKKAELEEMTKEELQKELDKKGVEYTQHETKDELIKKLSKA